MYENLKTLRLVCNVVVIASLSIYVILLFGGNNSVFLVLRVIMSATTLSACSIICGTEAMSNEILGNIFMMAIYLFILIFSTISLSFQ